MKTQSAKPRFPANPGGSGHSTLHGRKLTITQVVWVAVSLLAVTLFVAGLPLLYNLNQELGIYPPGDRDAVHAYLMQLGLSADLFAVLSRTRHHPCGSVFHRLQQSSFGASQMN